VAVKVCGQVVIMMYLLFYFLRNRQLILSTIASVLPLFNLKLSICIGETIRVALYDKLLVASIQGPRRNVRNQSHNATKGTQRMSEACVAEVWFQQTSAPDRHDHFRCI
jgi:hypothetical protein